MPLAELPADLLIQICAQLSSSDILSLGKACRVLHAFTCDNGYIWWDLHDSVSLDVFSEYVDIRSMSGYDLRCSYARALRLDQNWTKLPFPTLLNLQSAVLPQQHLMVQMVPVGPRGAWLVGLLRSTVSASACRICVWAVSTVGTLKEIASWPTGLKSSHIDAGISPDEEDIVIALLSEPIGQPRRKTLTLYSMKTKQEIWGYSHAERFSIRVVPEGFTFHGVKTNGALVVISSISFAALDIAHSPFRFDIVNIESRTSILVDPCLLVAAGTGHLRVALNSTCLTAYTVHARPNPVSLWSTHSITVWKANSLLDLKPLETGMPIRLRNDSTRESPQPMDGTLSEYVVSASGRCPHNTSHISCLLLSTNRGAITSPSFHRTDVELDGHSSRHTIAHLPFPYGPHAEFSISRELMAVGATGLRAVWLEIPLDGEAPCVLMRAMWIAGKWKVASLLKPHEVLPFDLRRISTVAFHEAMGRIFFSIHTGEIFSLSF